MSEYSFNLNTNLYKYMQPVYITEPTGERQIFIPLKLNLNSSNFNFDTARSDGLDFRLAELSNGTGVLQMWISYWDYTERKATVWFKLPEILGGETRTMYAYWGYAYDTGVSDLRHLMGESTEEEITYTDNLALGASTSGSSPAVANPERMFDGTLAYCEMDLDEWVQCNFTVPTKINKLWTVASDFGGNPRGFEIRASNDDFVSEDVLIVDVSDFLGFLEEGTYYFGNDTEYLHYRIINDKTSPSWVCPEVELYGINAAGVISTPVFLFGDDFGGTALDVNKWQSSTGSWSISNSKINLGSGAWIQTSVDIISTDPPVNWIVEEGIIGIGSPTSTTSTAHRYKFYGGENVLGINYYWEGGTDRTHDFVEAGTYLTYNGTNRGLEIGSYSHNYIAYYEPTDNVYQSMNNRNSYSDYVDSWERKVHRNTEITYFRIYGEGSSSANGVEIDWVIVRNYTPGSDLTVDYTDLWVDHEYVGHQSLDFIEYASDSTSVDFHHISDMGGDPYRMSDDITNSISNIFISDDPTTSGNLVIDFGRGRYSATDKTYIHFDSDRVDYYNAAKLSDLDTDVNSSDYWQGTTTSGWAAIQFPTTKDIACLALRAVPGSTSSMADNFKFYGSQSNPRFSGWNDKVLIYEGQARAVEEEQTFYFSTGLTFYEYYILEVLDTHGGNVAIQEWGMYERESFLGKKVISQLRLYPVIFTNNEHYFPKEIEFYGSNDGFSWNLLIPTTDTPTPFTDYAYGRWSRYSFDEFDTYYLYKLTCNDNWHAANDQIKIAEWEMVEAVEESNSIRILGGSTNDINNIWADSTTTMNSGTLYMTNDVLNTVGYEKLIQSTTVSGVDDFNVKL